MLRWTITSSPLSDGPRLMLRNLAARNIARVERLK